MSCKQYSVGLRSGTCRWLQVQKRGVETWKVSKPFQRRLRTVLCGPQEPLGGFRIADPYTKRTCGRRIAREALTIGAVSGWASVGCGPFQQTRSQITGGPREEPKARFVQGSHEKRPRTAAGRRCCASKKLEDRYLTCCSSVSQVLNAVACSWIGFDGAGASPSTYSKYGH